MRVPQGRLPPMGECDAAPLTATSLPRPSRPGSPAGPLLAAVRACAKALGVLRRGRLSAASYEAWAAEREGMPSRAVLVHGFGT